MSDTQYIIAIDVGGSSAKSGLVDFDLNITQHNHTPLDSKGSADEILTTLCNVIKPYLEQSLPLAGVGFGFPGPFEYDTGVARIHGLEKFEAIYGLNIGDELRTRLNQPDLTITFRNDAEAAILGEAKFGAGKGYSRLIGITLGTGIGSAFVVDGVRLISGEGVPEIDGFLNLEMYKGERADDIFSTRGVLARFKANGLPFDSVAAAKQAADDGDEKVREQFANFGTDLGKFLTPWVKGFHAEMVVYLGGISGASEYFDKQLNDEVSVSVKRGTMGGNAALLGAAESLLP